MHYLSENAMAMIKHDSNKEKSMGCGMVWHVFIQLIAVVEKILIGFCTQGS